MPEQSLEKDQKRGGKASASAGARAVAALGSSDNDSELAYLSIEDAVAAIGIPCWKRRIMTSGKCFLE